MKCKACGGRGYFEEQAGLVMVGCTKCSGTGEVPDEPAIMEPGWAYITDEDGKIKKVEPVESGEDIDGTARTESSDRPDGSAAASKPKKPRKPKAKKSTRKAAQ